MHTYRSAISCFAYFMCLVILFSAYASNSSVQYVQASGISSSTSRTGTVQPGGTSPAAGAQSALMAILSHPTASHRVKVQVPASMRSDPFEQDRYLNVPANLQIAVYARVPHARFMTVTPDDSLLVSDPGDGKVELIRPDNNGGDPKITNFVTGLKNPHDIVFHTIGQTTYMYLSESNQIDRFVYHNGDTQAQSRQVIVTNLPDSSTPELHGTYGHQLKNIALDSNNKLYISIGSSCNACVGDTQSTPVRGAIYQYNADGTDGHLYARGLRNAEGLAFVPGTNDLWVAVNNRDNIAYPQKDSSGNYGKVVPQYVDNHPPDEFIKLRAGGNYGWPFCNPNPDHGLDTMPFDQDVELNADGHVNCSQMDRVNKGIQAHSAPLGLIFLQSPDTATMGALISLHGSWNRTMRTGFKVIYFPWNKQTGSPGQQIDLVTGWMMNATEYPWGRPVDTTVDQQGNIFISDDASGTIYKLYYSAS